jgi:hypothetical protein
MRTSNYLILAVIFSVASMQFIHADGVFKWKDARGNIQYGDEPPANVKVDNFKMPDIMVVEGFKEQWQPLGADKPKVFVTNNAASQNPVVTLEKPSTYSKLAFIAPRNNQVIESGFKGEVSAMISIKPPLKKGHQIVFELDGKSVSKSKSRINNFSNLSGGTHTVISKIIDQRGNELIVSSPVTFNVVRTKANKKRATN